MRASEINLSPLVGAACTHVEIGPRAACVFFEGVGSIRLECPYELRSASGELLESRDAADGEKKESRLAALRTAKVASFEFSPPEGLAEVSDRFTLRFENGLALSVLHSDDQIESALIEYEHAQPRLQVI